MILQARCYCSMYRLSFSALRNTGPSREWTESEDCWVRATSPRLDHVLCRWSCWAASSHCQWRCLTEDPSGASQSTFPGLLFLLCNVCAVSALWVCECGVQEDISGLIEHSSPYCLDTVSQWIQSSLTSPRNQVLSWSHPGFLFVFCFPNGAGIQTPVFGLCRKRFYLLSWFPWQ